MTAATATQYETSLNVLVDGDNDNTHLTETVLETQYIADIF